MSHFQQLLSHLQDRDIGLTETSVLYENHVTLPSGLRTDRCERRLMSHMVEDQEARLEDTRRMIGRSNICFVSLKSSSVQR